MKQLKPAPIKPTIKYSDLDKVDIRVGTMEKVDNIEKSEKLAKLIVDFGDRKSNIIVGMKKERDSPKEIEGMLALFVVNLEPRKMRYGLSEGMLFDIGYADKIIPVLAVPEKPIPNGARAG
ncbi:tRNA-binding protein [Candidatus Woesearchaeota archaeon]|nr:tRNA-binding protein [Candidatus Woesearchaeota archaeon]